MLYLLFGVLFSIYDKAYKSIRSIGLKPGLEEHESYFNNSSISIATTKKRLLNEK